jgi:hypothetical protein
MLLLEKARAVADAVAGVELELNEAEETAIQHRIMALFPLLDGSKGPSELLTPELLWGFGLLWKDLAAPPTLVENPSSSAFSLLCLSLSALSLSLTTAVALLAGRGSSDTPLFDQCGWLQPPNRAPQHKGLLRSLGGPRQGREQPDLR